MTGDRLTFNYSLLQSDEEACIAENMSEALNQK